MVLFFKAVLHIVYVGFVVLGESAPNSEMNTTFQIIGRVVADLCSDYNRGNDDFVDVDSGTVGVNACCIVCKREPSCVETHSCCPGVEYQLTQIPYSTDEEGLICRHTVMISQVGNISVHSMYEIVDNCTDYSNDNDVIRCEYKDVIDDRLTLRYNTPVFDVIRQLTYGNVYCARCNGVLEEDLILWNIKLSCNESSLSEVRDNVKIDDVISAAGCGVLFEPPDDAANTKLCFNDVIDTCNVTGRWKAYNATIATFCNVLDMLFVSLEDRITLYRNLFCALCNGERIHINEVAIEFCPSVGEVLNEFVALLRMSIEELEEPTTDTECRLGMIYDPILGRCSRVYCSLPNRLDPITLTCKLFYTDIAQCIISVPLQIKFVNHTNFSEALNMAEDIMSLLYNSGIIYGQFRPCHSALFYQTTFRNQANNLTFIQTDDLAIESLYIVFNLYSFSIDETILKNLEDSFRNLLISFNYTYESQHTFDPTMFKFFVDNQTILLSLEKEFFAETSDTEVSHYVFTNRYNGKIILGQIENSQMQFCIPNMYLLDHLDCANFLYDDTDLFTRTENGIKIVHSGIEALFDFSEFRQTNSQSLKICSQSVIDRFGFLTSNTSRLCGQIVMNIILFTFILV